MAARRTRVLEKAAPAGHYLSIASQVAAAISADFSDEGTPLPGERRLALHYQVSRRTIRKAVEELTIHGWREKQTATPRRQAAKRERAERIALLMAEPLENLRPYTALWVYRLSERLSRAGLQLDIHHGQRFFGPASARSRDILVKEAGAACWLLSGSNLPLQEWFQGKQIPAVIAGTPHQGICLPGVDIDHRAMCRHAVSVLHRHHHRRIALFLENRHRQGDGESEQGFLEAASACGIDMPLVFRLDRDPKAVVSALKRALGATAPITGFVMASPFSCLTAMTYLAEIRHTVPGNVSLISCHEEPYLSHLRPAPAHYICSPGKLATAIYKTVQKVLRGTSASSHFIMPNFIAGASLAEPPAT
jgi:LacI family transcriptional regulator